MADDAARIGNYQVASAPVLRRDPSTLALLSDLRHSEVLPISTRLGRISNHKWESDRFFGALAVLFFGGALGGLIGAFPFFGTHPTHAAKVAYVATLLVAVFIAILCGVARLCVRSERAESVAAI